MLQLIMTRAIKDRGAGLFLSSARSLHNDGIFTTSTGLGNINIELGDCVVMLKGLLLHLSSASGRKMG